MEHRHGCVYCGTGWSCEEDCPIAGPSVCEACRQKLLDAPPGTPYKVIPLDRSSGLLDNLLEHEAARLARQLQRRARPQ